METKSITSRHYFRGLSILFWSIFAASIVVLFLVFFFHRQNISCDPGIAQVILIIFPLLAFSALLGSVLYFRIKMNSVAEKKKLSEKLLEYRSVLVLRWGIVGMASYLSIFAYMVTQSTIILAIIAFILIFFLLQKPSPLKAITDMQLGPEDQKKINDPDQVVIDHFEIR
jgi:hypothetical protein